MVRVHCSSLRCSAKQLAGSEELMGPSSRRVTRTEYSPSSLMDAFNLDMSEDVQPSLFSRADPLLS